MLKKRIHIKQEVLTKSCVRQAHPYHGPFKNTHEEEDGGTTTGFLTQNSDSGVIGYIDAGLSGTAREPLNTNPNLKNIDPLFIDIYDDGCSDTGNVEFRKIIYIGTPYTDNRLRRNARLSRIRQQGFQNANHPAKNKKKRSDTAESSFDLSRLVNKFCAPFSHGSALFLRRFYRLQLHIRAAGHLNQVLLDLIKHAGYT